MICFKRSREEVRDLGLSRRVATTRSSSGSGCCCCFASRPRADLRSFTVMICSVPVGQTEIKVAGITDTGDQLFLLTLRLVALVGEDFLFLFALTVPLCGRTQLSQELYHVVLELGCCREGKREPEHFSCISSYNCGRRTGDGLCKKVHCKRHIS